jgi:uncharacterized membrane protein YidH (DUF202 family)
MTRSTLDTWSDAVPVADADAQLLQFVRERDVECPGCGYNVRNLTSDRCPECGEQLQLGLRLVEPRQAAPIAGLVGLAAGFGLGGLLLIYAGIVSILMKQGGGLDRFVTVNSVGFIVHGAALWLWVRNWKRIRRLNPRPRWLLVAAAWAMPLAFVVIFAMYIR